MPADRPDVAALHKGGFLQCGGEVEIIILDAFLLFTEQVGQFLFIKACEQRIEVSGLQSFDLYAQKLLIPTGIHRHAVVRNDIRFLLSFSQMVGKHTGDLGDAFFLGGKNTTVTGNDAVVTVDNDRIDEAELPQGRTQLCDLLRRVGARVVHIRDKP